ncbi:hypothetical protein FB45DRAFT_1032157 [Roridomyces roridus]|uniref:CxC1-like cysteine cluster associated with KDZ transposases domain-containing protein n=1 Tax=Roridomyces roridus TaxID=1738132 RepID=A0AAD7BJ16_9AGAR|nr:hypothetical protein FB45DRAFT_1032157 [Roridomyces roridus]
MGRLTAKDIEAVKVSSSKATAPPKLFPVKTPANLLKKKNANEPEPLVFYANGQTLSQRLQKPPQGQVGWRDARRQGGPQSSPTKRQYADVALASEDNYVTADYIPGQPAAQTSRAVKKSNQWHRWTHEVIPALVPVFVDLMHQTKSLRDTAELRLQHSDCACAKRALYVAVVRLNASTRRRLQVLARPSYAAPSGIVSLLAGPPELGRHAAVDATLELIRETVIGPSIASPASPSTTPAGSRPCTPPPPSPSGSDSDSSRSAPATPTAARPVPPAPSGRKRRAPDREHKHESKANPFPDPPPRTRPSDYLISRCPTCFGGLVHDPTAACDIHVCADAGFTQKRRRGGPRDPPRTHPNTVFVPEHTTDEMGAHVEDVRPVRGQTKKRARPSEEEDHYEHQDLRVPRTVLDDCRDSFIAADKKREKASTKFFEDTGVMGLLCRHDRVLWLVNMRSSSEKQYFVLVLLETLFQHLPLNIHIGILYDIACQLHRSCVKYKFMERYMDRMIFAVSVFHAFGHRWPCQLIYHPMKCCGFGHTNGKGCERFWHSISKLIAYLRVTGIMCHADKMSLGRMGSWILRRTEHCENKMREARADLVACGVPVAQLRVQWADQVKVQTQPLKSQSKNAAKQAVDTIIAARAKQQQLWQRWKALSETQVNEDADAEAHDYATTHVQDALKAWETQAAKTKQLERTLGVNDSTILKKLKFTDYYTARMNARAVKDRLRARLRDRKFEMDPIERSVRRTRSENQRNEHAGAAIKRREPNISRLVQTYNKLCEQIQSLISKKKAPPHSVAPLPVPSKGIYQLDVDDVIWQDLGLDEEESRPPLWLSDEKVRTGIRAMLMVDRCNEESARLMREHAHLFVWFQNEWKTIQMAIAQSEGAVRYQMERRREELLQLCVLWRKSLDRIPLPTEQQWGPTDDEFLDEDLSDEDEQEDEDEAIFHVVAAVERADNHRAGDEVDALSWDDDAEL